MGLIRDQCGPLELRGSHCGSVRVSGGEWGSVRNVYTPLKDAFFERP